LIPEDGMKKIIVTSNAPGVIGPYSQGVEINGFLYTSGQIAMDPETGAMAEGIEAQTEGVLQNLKAVLDEAGYSLSDVIKATVFLKSMDDFSKMNGVYETFFTDKYPARIAVEVSRLPKNALVEIDMIASR
jgi:2-iminobutanoate/2-iminopropanoate deaminase